MRFPILLASVAVALSSAALTSSAALALTTVQPQTLTGAEADQLIANIETGGVDKDAEHPDGNGAVRISFSRIDCNFVFLPERADEAKTSCSVLYSDRMGEDGRHYKVVPLDTDQAQQVYNTLKDLFGARRLGPELVTGAQDVECVKSPNALTTCTLSRLQQPRSH